jgi:hypothetical protein
MMDINTPKGSKIIYANVGGYNYNKEDAKQHLKFGGVYTIKKISVGQSFTTVWLEEAPGTYSSVQFENWDKTKCPCCNRDIPEPWVIGCPACWEVRSRIEHGTFLESELNKKWLLDTLEKKGWM